MVCRLVLAHRRGVAPHVPTPADASTQADRDKAAVVEQLAGDLKFFHWELEFPDVFTPERSGFDALIGNPPWDVMKPNSQEFFTEFDPLYRTYDKQAALRRQRELFQTVPGVTDQWDEYNARFKALGNWARNAAEPFDLSLARGKEGEPCSGSGRSTAASTSAMPIPTPLPASGQCRPQLVQDVRRGLLELLQQNGRLGVILPTGIYSDFGTKDLREELLDRGRIDFLYAFQNEKRVFAAAHHAYKQVALIADPRGQHGVVPHSLPHGRGRLARSPRDPRRPAAERLGGDGLHARRRAEEQPEVLSLVELRSPRDLAIFRKIYDHSIRIGDNAPGWEITYAREFHMTNDSKLFPPLEKWEAKGYKPDVFGRWIGPDGEVALPLYQGSDDPAIRSFFQKGWVERQGSNCSLASDDSDRLQAFRAPSS